MTLLDAISTLHEKSLSLSGTLVLFPRSPVISMDVWAIQVEGLGGMSRYFTLVNFTEEDGEFKELKKIDARLREFWNQNPGGVYKGRNKYLNLKVKIKVSGTANIISPRQANPQIELTAKDINLD